MPTGQGLTIAQQDQLRLSASQANYTQTCVPCKKTFYSQNAFNNHLSSKRHRIATLRLSSRLDARDDESVAGSETVSLGMSGSVASLDDVQAIEQGVDRMEIVDEEVIPLFECSDIDRTGKPVIGETSSGNLSVLLKSLKHT